MVCDADDRCELTALASKYLDSDVESLDAANSGQGKRKHKKRRFSDEEGEEPAVSYILIFREAGCRGGGGQDM
jgi:hypothetical protein